MNIYSKLDSSMNKDEVSEQDLYKDLSSISRMIWHTFNKQAGFYALFLTQLDKRFVDDKQVPTAGVYINGLNYALDINKEFWLSIDEEIRKVGLLIHEVIHVMFDHYTTMFNYSDNDLWQIAADLQNNTIVQDIFGNHSLPGCTDTLIWNNTHKPALEDIHTRYNNKEITKEEATELAKKIPFRPILLDDYAVKYNLTKTDCINKGLNWIYNKLLEYNDTDNMKNQAGISILHDLDITHPSDHVNEQNIQKEYSLSSQKLISNQKNNLLSNILEDENIKKNIGNLPLELRELVDSIINPKPPVTDWKQAIRDWIGGYSTVFSVRRTKMKINLIIENGYRLKMKSNKHLLLLLDTSGSMSIKNDIPEVLEEAYNIYKVTNAQITVAEIDTKIHDVWELDSLKSIQDKLKKGISGRGGTSIDCIHDFLLESKGKYTGIIYLTDGEVYPPSKRIPIPFILLKSSFGNDTYIKTWKENNYKTLKIEKNV